MLYIAQRNIKFSCFQEFCLELPDIQKASYRRQEYYFPHGTSSLSVEKLFFPLLKCLFLRGAVFISPTATARRWIVLPLWDSCFTFEYLSLGMWWASGGWGIFVSFQKSEQESSPGTQYLTSLPAVSEGRPPLDVPWAGQDPQEPTQPYSCHPIKHKGFKRSVKVFEAYILHKAMSHQVPVAREVTPHCAWSLQLLEISSSSMWCTGMRTNKNILYY